MKKTEYKEIWVTVESRNLMWYRKNNGPPNVLTSGVPLNREPLHERTIKLFHRRLAEGKVEWRDELVLLGTYLYEGLFDQKINVAFEEEWNKAERQGSTILRLVLEFKKEAREFAQLPWEYLYYPDKEGHKGFFLATRSRLVLARHVPLDEEFNRDLKPDEKPLKILLVVSTPEYDEDGTELGVVKANPTIETVKKLEKPHEIVVKELYRPTKRSLFDTIRTECPHVLHFIGHGHGSNSSDGGGLALVQTDDPEKASWISDIDLSDCFMEHQPRLIFLQACEGALNQSYEAFGSVALQLVYSRIPAVVAMQYEIENKVANSFAEIFYRSLGAGMGIDEAVQAGRLELGIYLDEGKSFSSRAFGSPVVYLQSAQGIVMAEAVVEEEIVASTVGASTSSTAGKPFCPNMSCDARVIPGLPRCLKCKTSLRVCSTCGNVTLLGGPCIFCDAPPPAQAASSLNRLSIAR